MNEKIKIILDTDIGDDADDALALCLALKSPELEVLGITTVFRNTTARAKIAVALLNMMGKNHIPVYAGIGKPLVAQVNTKEPPIQLLENMKGLSYSDDMGAVEYLYHTLKYAEESVTLVAIGPLTNIAVLLLMYPEIISRVHEIVLMGGAFYMHYTEWNIFCDPEAAEIVFSSGIPIRAIGLDVTTCCQVDDALVEYLKEAEQKWAEDLHLHSYEEWKQYVCADMAAHGYKWYVDNWLYAEAKCNNKEVLGSIDILGNTHQIIKEDFTHKISGKQWSCVSIAEDEAICGFIFTKEDK